MPEAQRKAEEGLRELVNWAVGVTFEDLPQEIARRAALTIIDDIAAMVAAGNEPAVRKLQEGVIARSGPREATIFGAGRPRADRANAALANGTAGNWCELEGGYRKALCHANLYTVPALLAEAEAEGLSVAEVLRAAALGYEIVVRFAQTWRFEPVVLHSHAVFSAVGATAALALAGRLDPPRFIDALTAAATLSSAGPFDHAVRGALIENTWAGVGAWCGFRCVEWAQYGIRGLPESPYRVYTALGADTLAERLTDGLGRQWAIADGYHKIYACCGYAHSALEAILSALPNLPPGKGPSDIDRVLVETHRMGLTLDNPRPATTLAARFSMQHAVASACVLRHAGAEAFATRSLEMPEIARLRERVELRLFEPERPWPKDRPARITIRLGDGEELSAECLSAQGGPDRPFPPETILEKAAGLTAGVYPGFAAAAGRLAALDRSVLDRPWDDMVGDMTEGERA